MPFAAPPVGDLRFAPPQPPVPWEGTRDATEDGPICPQAVLPLEGPLADVISATQPQDEDCLTLNVMTPARRRRAAGDGLDPRRRVHGGSGSTPIYDGTLLRARRRRRSSSINYRLGALGFLHLDELFEGAKRRSGNLGILDQVARARVGARQHRRVRRRPGQRHDLRRVGRRHERRHTARHAERGRAVPPRDPPERARGSHNVKAETATRVAKRVLELLEVEPGDWEALRAVPVQRFVEVSQQLSMLESRALLGDDLAMAMVLLPVVDGVIRDKTAAELVAAGNAATSTC